ncbi:hypothetical protein HN371_29985 [Candidatus Poribacteria bacterium]|jgi:hypothetical protein|nr:hypothetical protein [Candidatus Poribacteria bacterium]MBT5535229.1 hypothetical protein [Candidatus Poribacteria bacterium]MBT5715164.1 hypothetical protein [Candidatus Poribacteria bacterium]MBT7807375.1 hypothetical protein [Candidatus Poribacteria bacterium]
MNSSVKWILALIGILIVWMWISSAAQKKTAHAVERQAPQRASRQVVGVARQNVTTTMDLSDKLNPSILPDVLKEVLKEVSPNQKPESEAFQQEVVKKFSQKIMDDPEINYRVDLNGDENMDPVLVVPESVEGEAAVYSVRVPDPDKHKTDPPANADWNQIAKDGIELAALSVTFDEGSKTMSVDAEPNEYLYKGGSRHYRSEYPARNHSWMESYFTYMIFRDVLFRPYGWYGPGWYGGWYGGYYGGWHAPIRTRTVVVNNTYRRSTGSSVGARTSSGRTVRSTRASTRSAAPSFVRRSGSSAAARSGSRTPTRSGSRTTTSRSSSRSGGSFRGGGFGGGK